MSFEKVTSDVHEKRFSRNMGVGLCLAAFIVLMFGLSAVKIRQAGATEGFDHVARPALIPAEESQ
ncbi:MAG: hypothetical protein AAGI10_06910 [Pseudomonadota bacterium]